MARRPSASKHATSWRFLALIGIIALIAISLLLIRHDYPSPPSPTPKALRLKAKNTTATQQKPLSTADFSDNATAATQDAATESPSEPALKGTQQQEMVQQPSFSQTAAKGVVTILKIIQAFRPPVAKPLPAALPEAEPTASPQPAPAPVRPDSPIIQRTALLDAPPSPSSADTTGNKRDRTDTKGVTKGPGVTQEAAEPAVVVYFDFDAVTLSAAEQSRLLSFSNMLEGNVSSVRIDGYADAIGAPDYNQRLSKNRAAYVASLIAAATGYDASRIQLQAWGERRPAVPNISPTHRQLNRRVTIHVNYGEKPTMLVKQKLGRLLPFPAQADQPPKAGPALPGRIRPLEQAALRKHETPKCLTSRLDVHSLLVSSTVPSLGDNYYQLRDDTPQDVVHFSFDSATVPPAQEKVVLALAATLDKDAMITLAAHTDVSGSQEYNLELSRRRALAVAALLLRGSSSPPLVRILELGENFPAGVDSAVTPSHPRRCDRRVEIYVASTYHAE